MPFLLKPKPLVAVAAPTEIIESELESVIAELHAVEIELGDSGRAILAYRAQHRDLKTNFVGLTAQVNLWQKHPQLRVLESCRDHVIRKRNEILNRYATAKMRLQNAVKEARWM